MKVEAFSTPERRGSSTLLNTTPGKQDSQLANQKRFWSVVQESAQDAVRNALGDTILGVLTGQKMLESPDQAREFTERLKTVFGVSGAKTLQFIIAKDLYQRLGLPFKPDGLFNYETFLESAKNEFLARNIIRR